LLIIGNPKVNLPPQEGITKTGFVPYKELNLYLAACDILLLPLTDNLANRGRWPSKIGDYFAAGRPTVACAVGDMEQVLGETGAGLTTAPAAQPFAEGIMSLLNDPDLRASMGAKARHAAESRYNWQTLVDQLASVYDALLH
jgi:glycosyltransferase involved in cell wall biosynthesis